MGDHAPRRAGPLRERVAHGGPEERPSQASSKEREPGSDKKGTDCLATAMAVVVAVVGEGEASATERAQRRPYTPAGTVMTCLHVEGQDSPLACGIPRPGLASARAMSECALTVTGCGPHCTWGLLQEGLGF
ncbi:hypothetical protein TREES_T100008814 [Tupaia chinensis]|uniref:Uncharacterized protein n=1 Tax=Tupaia chinensis TaxID=246437 RepID=L9L551_TUPCH|nr:hypothetical protein TREES_T100008814 [Tupaia chinensis]